MKVFYPVKETRNTNLLLYIIISYNSFNEIKKLNIFGFINDIFIAKIKIHILFVQFDSI